jgi:Protein of unknown function (DUF2934)
MATNTNNIEDAVRRRAYELWEQYGRPEGGAEEFCEIRQAKGLNGTAQTGKNKPRPQSRQGE